MLGNYDGDDQLSRCKFNVDINRLIDTRLLIQASSGGGKSWLLRKLIEELYGKVQVIVLDIEGEFSSLREKFDFILAGKGGDITADPKYAEVLARKVLELEIDLIADLYELKQPERIRFVKLFLEAMINAPKELWHPVVIILDEAHIFAPEKQKNAEALNAVADMVSRGRKRGFCLCVATQRPAKISKDVIAECQNKLIGLGNTDIERQRGAVELGFTDREKILTMRDLEPGQFYAVGPAFSERGANLVTIGQVKTKHPRSGSGRIKMRTPMPTQRVKAQIAKLVDLPREAEEEKNTIKSLQEQIVKFRQVLKQTKTPVVASVDPKALEKAFQRGVAVTEGKLGKLLGEIGPKVNQAGKSITAIQDLLLTGVTIELPSFAKEHAPAKPAAKLIPRTNKKVATPLTTHDAPDGSDFKACERKILGFLAMNPNKFYTLVQVGAMTGYRNSSGGFNNAISKLSKAGLIKREPGRIAFHSDVDVSHLIDNQPHNLEDWIAKLKKCERAIYEKLLSDSDRVFSVQEMAEETGYSDSSGGFNNAISRLSTLGLLTREGRGQIRFNPEVLSVAAHH